MDESQSAARAPIPVPVPNADNAGFWEACRRHELRLQRCRACGQLRHPPRPMCPQCTALEHEWAAVSGRGTVYSFTIVHGPTLAAFQEHAPYNVVVVQLAEGPFMVSNLVGCNAGDIRIGMPVEVVFEAIAETTTLPKFQPV